MELNFLREIIQMKNDTSIDILNYIKIFNVNNSYNCCVCRKKFKIKVNILSKMNVSRKINSMEDFAFKKV